MTYAQENFQDWIFYISDKMDYFITEFAKENHLKLDYSIESLDEIEKWLLDNFDTINAIKENPEILDLLTIYIGETFRKHISGKWFMDLENKDNAYYHMPVLTNPEYKGTKYKSPLTYATACIDRKKGSYISTILQNNIKSMFPDKK